MAIIYSYMGASWAGIGTGLSISHIKSTILRGAQQSGPVDPVSTSLHGTDDPDTEIEDACLAVWMVSGPGSSET
jgi:hypothetical protein